MTITFSDHPLLILCLTIRHFQKPSTHIKRSSFNRSFNRENTHQTFFFRQGEHMSNVLLSTKRTHITNTLQPGEIFKWVCACVVHTYIHTHSTCLRQMFKMLTAAWWQSTRVICNHGLIQYTQHTPQTNVQVVACRMMTEHAGTLQLEFDHGLIHLMCMYTHTSISLFVYYDYFCGWLKYCLSMPVHTEIFCINYLCIFVTIKRAWKMHTLLLVHRKQTQTLRPCVQSGLLTHNSTINIPDTCSTYQKTFLKKYMSWLS